MVDKIPTEGFTLSELPALPLPLRVGDRTEAIRRRADDPGRYKNHNFFPTPADLPLATTEQYGLFILGQNATTSDLVLAAIVNMLDDQIAAGAGISLNYNSGTGILTISAASSPTGPLNGDLNVIGRMTYTGWSSADISEGSLRCIAPVFRFDEMAVVSIYQHYPVQISSEEALTNLAISAIDGEYAICLEIAAFSPNRNIAITPYFVDADIKVEADLEPYTMMAGEDVTVITCGESYVVTNIFMVRKGMFIVNYKQASTYDTNSHMVLLVEYTNSLDASETTIEFEFDEIPELEGVAYFFDNKEPMLALNMNTGKVSIVLFIRTDEETEGAPKTQVMFEIDPVTKTATFLSATTVITSPIAAFYNPDNITIPENIYEEIRTELMYKENEGSYLNVRYYPGTNTSGYGVKLRYTEYETRNTPGGGGPTNYEDETSYSEIFFGDMVTTKLAAIGYTDVTEGNLNFGTVALYMS